MRRSLVDAEIESLALRLELEQKALNGLYAHLWLAIHISDYDECRYAIDQCLKEIEILKKRLQVLIEIRESTMRRSA